MKFVFTQEELEKALISPYYKSHSIISESCVLVEEYKQSVTLDRPLQISVTILELSKLIMYRYEILIRCFNES